MAIEPTTDNGWSSWYCTRCGQGCASDNPCDCCESFDLLEEMIMAGVGCGMVTALISDPIGLALLNAVESMVRVAIPHAEDDSPAP